MATDHLEQEGGGHVEKEDGDGFIILESSTEADPASAVAGMFLLMAVGF